MVGKFIKTVICGLILAVILAPVARSWTIFPNLGDERAGTASMQFLKLGAGGRAAAMGNSVAATCIDGYALYWNPAALVWDDHHKIALSHNMWVVDVSYDFAGYSMKIGEDRAIGVSVIYLGTPNMNVTDEYHPFGTGEKFGFADLAVGLSISQRLTDYFSFGGTFKFAQESLENLKMRGFLLDLGTYYQTNFHGTSFSMTLSNFGQQVKPSGSYYYTNLSGDRIPKSYQSFSPPTVFRLAAAADILKTERDRWQGTIQLDHPTDNTESFSFGSEYGFGKSLFLRGGYRLNNDTQSYSLGLGLKISMFSTDGSFDYAFSSVGNLGHSNTFSFQWSF
jgi:hypothetical protein